MCHSSPAEEGLHTADSAARILSRSHLEEEMVVLATVRECSCDMEQLQTKTNLPWSVLRETTGSLLEAGLMTVEDTSQSPRLNLKAKGLELIEKYRDVLERIATARAVIEIESR